MAPGISALCPVSGGIINTRPKTAHSVTVCFELTKNKKYKYCPRRLLLFLLFPAETATNGAKLPLGGGANCRWAVAPIAAGRLGAPSTVLMGSMHHDGVGSVRTQTTADKGGRARVLVGERCFSFVVFLLGHQARLALQGCRGGVLEDGSRLDLLHL